MSNPKFSVGEAVMVRTKAFPEMNCDFAIIVSQRSAIKEVTMLGNIYSGWLYVMHNNGDGEFMEASLRPIPPEKHNGIDASEYIKNLTGVTV